MQKICLPNITSPFNLARANLLNIKEKNLLNTHPFEMNRVFQKGLFDKSVKIMTLFIPLSQIHGNGPQN